MMKETIDLFGKILTNILTALYEPFGFSLFLSFFAMFFYLYVYEPTAAGKGSSAEGIAEYLLLRHSRILLEQHIHESLLDYSGALWATCPDFESHHSGEWEPYIPVIQSHSIGLYYIYFLYTVNTHLWCEYR